MGGGKTTTNTVAEPPKFLQPFLRDAAGSAESIYSQQFQDAKQANAVPISQFIPNSPVVDFSPETQQALGLISNRAINGAPASNDAQRYAASQITGSGLNSDPFANGSRGIAGQLSPVAGQVSPIAGNFAGGSNPYLDQTFNRAADSVQQRLQSGFASSGRNIDAGRPVAAQELNDLATNIYGGDYQNQQARYLQALQGDQATNLNALQGDQTRRLGALQGDQSTAANAYSDERKRQDYLASIAPTLDQTDYQDAQALAGVGAARENLSGQQQQQMLDQLRYDQGLQGSVLDSYIARIQGAYPGQSQQSQQTPPPGNRFAGAAGGALAGYQIGGPYGAAIGGLGGYFLS